MKIVIVGCGKVGTSIASELNLAGHNIVVIDINRAAVTRLSDSIDGMGIEGNGATYETLSEAGAGDADLVIAVTARDEVNLYTCLMARTCGCPNTIARVRNPEYTNDLFRVKDILGLSMFINPELTAAVEISRLLRFSGALEIDSFSKGMFELIKVGVPKNSPLVDRAISRIDILRGKVRICTVERDNEVYIPNGEFVIRAGDRISIASKPEIAAKFFKKAELNIARSRDVMILGGGKISYYLAQRLLKAGVNVKIIEKNAQRCEELSEMLHDAVIIHGDCMDQDLLLSEGVEHTDGVAALMDYDEENILISMYIKNISKAKAITKVNNAHFDSIIDQIDLECVINPKKIAGEYIARYVRAVQNSLGSNLAELSLKDDLQIICIARKGRIILPVGSDMILPDDSVVIITKHKGLSDLNDILR